VSTLLIIKSVIDRLKVKCPKLEVVDFPERPADYRLNHPKGALLVSFAGSRFTSSSATHAIIQERNITISVTVVVRQLNGHDGAIAVLDGARQALIGFKPESCVKKISAVSEKFIAETAGIWQYALDVQTTDMQIQDDEVTSDPFLTHITSNSEFSQVDIRKQADGSISTQEN